MTVIAFRDPRWDPSPRLNPFPAPLLPWWHMTYDIITIQGASSLMALTSPSCHCTHYAHACPSFCRTLSSSVAPSGESPGPALLSEHRWGVSSRPPSRPPSLGLSRRFWVPHRSSLPAPQCTPPALDCSGDEGRTLIPEGSLCLPADSTWTPRRSAQIAHCGRLWRSPS